MKNRNLYIAILLTFIFNATVLSAQVISDAKGRPLKQIEYFELDGSPFFLKTWVKGDVIFDNGKIIKNVELKYDQVKDALIFLSNENEELYFIDPIKEFNLNDGAINYLFRNGFAPYKDFSSDTYFEILLQGKIMLLKKVIKTIVETKEYNSATTIKKIINNLNLYIVKDNKIIATSKESIKIIANAIDPQKSSSLIEFSELNKLNPRKEEDLKKILKYYNSMP
ncbi:hypothetical protein [Pedobacter boryungensis]|uniref:DUF4369 domain-containing protein n=1 Tax=Pedobacter boryungensis TaxID=869962 RepID=A0ABX2DAP7_9SPHI|nr:hypothetical protein [Pedobacter boryungensis]NQX30907.1 hypothetical protein [Pedobacter boryungensis]